MEHEDPRDIIERMLKAQDIGDHVVESILGYIDTLEATARYYGNLQGQEEEQERVKDLLRIMFSL